MVDYSADIQISECMNDIINQVETREWNRVNEHRDRLVKKMKKQKATIEEMKDDWEVATEKIAQENCDLHNEIKKLKNQMKLLKYENEKLKVWCLSDEMIERTSAETIEEFEMDVEDNWHEMKLLKDENEKLKSSLMNSSGSFKCEKCNIHLTEDDVYMSVDECEGKLLCESCWED